MKSGKWILCLLIISTALCSCQRKHMDGVQAGMGNEKEGDLDTAPSQIQVETAADVDTGIKHYIYVPNQFVVYTDGEPHRLMYAADADYYHYATFKNVSLEDYGFESISLPESITTIDYMVPEGMELSDIGIPNMSPDEVIDDSISFSQTRDIYSIRTPGMYLFHAWVDECDLEIHTLTLKDFADLLKIGGSLTSDFEDLEILEDGSTRYTCLYKDDREYSGDGVPYYGKAVIRLKDGKAWCAIFAEKDHEDGPRMAEYVLKQSVKYGEGSTR